MLSRLLDRLENRVGRHNGIRHLMTYVVFGTAIVFLADYILPMAAGFSLSSWLSFDKSAILQGQIWRVFTFVFIPLDGSLFTLVLSLYFDWLMGEYLQNTWGTFRFTLFYFTGILGAVIAGTITGYATAYYLNTSLMLAMACIQPNMELRLYGLLSFRLKWLALLSVAMMALPMLRVTSWHEPVALAAALLNVLIFFADQMMKHYRQAQRHRQWKKNWRSGWKR